jgi:hypothetical protein
VWVKRDCAWLVHYLLPGNPNDGDEKHDNDKDNEEDDEHVDEGDVKASFLAHSQITFPAFSFSLNSGLLKTSLPL